MLTNMRYIFKITDDRDGSVVFDKEQIVRGRQDMIRKKIDFRKEYYSFFLRGGRSLKVSLKK